MKTFSSIVLLLLFSLSQFSYAHASVFYTFDVESLDVQSPIETEAQVRKKYILTKSNLQKNVKGGGGYIKRLDTVLDSIQGDPIKISKILIKVNEIKETQGNLDDSDERKILVNYIYYKILTFEYDFFKTGAIQEAIVENKSTNLIEKSDIVAKSEKEDVKKLSDFPKPSKPWRDNFTVLAPEKGFIAQFFNTETSDVGTTENIDKISISSEGSLGGISSNDLGAYIVGNIEIEESAVYEFTVSQNWAQTRMLIDDRLVYSGEDDSDFFLYLEKGEHTLEIEHINNWHTVELIVNYTLPIEEYTLQDLISYVPDQSGEVWFVGIYQPGSKNDEVVLRIPETIKEISLILTSYSSTNWVIENPKNSKIRDIVYSSHSPGTSISGIDADTKIYKVSKHDYDAIPYMYDTLPDCYDDGSAYYHCEGEIDEFQTLNKKVESIYGKRLTGFSGEYSSEEGFTLPEKVLDNAGYAKVEQEYQNLLDEKDKVENTKNFNNMFDN